MLGKAAKSHKHPSLHTRCASPADIKQVFWECTERHRSAVQEHAQLPGAAGVRGEVDTPVAKVLILLQFNSPHDSCHALVEQVVGLFFMQSHVAQ